MLKEYDFLAILDQNPNQRQGLLMGNQVPMLSMRDEIKQLRIDCAAARGTYNMQCGYVKELKDEITQLRTENEELRKQVELALLPYA